MLNLKPNIRGYLGGHAANIIGLYYRILIGMLLI